MTVHLRKWLILTHRYLGIVLSLLFVMWFVSGIAMIFARGMPELTRDMRIEHLTELNMGAVKLTPAEALAKAELDRAPSRAVLLMIMGRPAYRFTSNGTVMVFADTGEVLEEIGKPEAIKIAGSFMELPESKLDYEGELNEPDQWTLEQRRDLPMHKISVNDDSRTELYVSEESGEVELMTTRGSRALAWVAAIPHWMYFAPLRVKDQMWRQIVLWTSGVGAVLAVLGIILSMTQFATRYAGFMRWHYVTGTIFGVFALTWVFSGWLSMEPYFWASGGGTGNRIRQTLSGGPLDLTAFPAVGPGTWYDVLAARFPKEIEFARIQDDPYFIARGIAPEPVLLSASPFAVRREPFSIESLMNRVRQGNPNVEIVESQVLSAYDSYYHPGGSEARRPPLPVLRVKFGDPDATWFYIDPHMGQVAGRFTWRQRLERWVYHGFHSLDFNFWYYNGTVWRATMVALNAGGALLSGIGLVLAVKRVKKGISHKNAQKSQKVFL
jgi:hypothetical protein